MSPLRTKDSLRQRTRPGCWRVVADPHCRRRRLSPLSFTITLPALVSRAVRPNGVECALQSTCLRPIVRPPFTDFNHPPNRIAKCHSTYLYSQFIHPRSAGHSAATTVLVVNLAEDVEDDEYAINNRIVQEMARRLVFPTRPLPGPIITAIHTHRSKSR